jgi:hypothetical protein
VLSASLSSPRAARHRARRCTGSMPPSSPPSPRHLHLSTRSGAGGGDGAEAAATKAAEGTKAAARATATTTRSSRRRLAAQKADTREHGENSTRFRQCAAACHSPFNATPCMLGSRTLATLATCVVCRCRAAAVFHSRSNLHSIPAPPLPVKHKYRRLAPGGYSIITSEVILSESFWGRTQTTQVTALGRGAQEHAGEACRAPRPSAGTRGLQSAGAGCGDGCSRVHRCIGSAV